MPTIFVGLLTGSGKLMPFMMGTAAALFTIPALDRRDRNAKAHTSADTERATIVTTPHQVHKVLRRGDFLLSFSTRAGDNGEGTLAKER